MSGRNGSSSDLTVPLIFMPAGDPEPAEWMAAHPGWIKIAATLVPRGPASSGSGLPPEIAPTALAGTAVLPYQGSPKRIGTGIGELLTAAAAPLAALGILLYPSRTAPPEMDELYPGGKGFDPHPPMPPLPGLTPPPTGIP